MRGKKVRHFLPAKENKVIILKSEFFFLKLDINFSYRLKTE